MSLIKYLIALVFGAILRVRHWLFDKRMIKSHCFDVPIIGVGNLKVGGTGKTPVTEFLIRNFKSKYNVAVLSRGYKRKTRGFVLADSSSTSRTIGDEPMIYHLRHPDIKVAVCESRVEGVERLMKIDPSINLIVLDDAFQHRYIETSLDVILTEFESPYYRDNLLPYGSLRDLKRQADRATYVMVTKCPEDVKPIDLRVMLTDLKLHPYQSIFFTKMVEGEIFPLFDRGYEEDIKSTILKGDNVVLMTAIANPKYLRESISKKYNIVGEIKLRDHHNYKNSDIEKAIKLAQASNAFIVVTEKDGVKIKGMNIASREMFRFFVAPIDVEFVDMDNNDNKKYFINSLDKRLHSKNGKYCINNRQFNK